MRLPRKLTGRWLKNHKACEEEIDIFEEKFPNGIDLSNKEEVKKGWAKMSFPTLLWFIEELGIDTSKEVPCDGKLCGNMKNCDKKIRVHSKNRKELRKYAIKAGLPL